MRATWEDFSSKYGFGDGDQLEDRDFKAREKLIEFLNLTPGMQKANRRAVAYDRPGVHNACLVVILPATPDVDDATLVRWWARGDFQEAALPDLELCDLPAEHPLLAGGLEPDDYLDVSDLVALAYAQTE